MSRAADVRTIARMATQRVPAVAPARWQLDHERLALSHATPDDPSAWIQLGATLEALAIGAAANGFAIGLHTASGGAARAGTPDLAIGLGEALALEVSECTIPRGMDRLLDCLEHSADGAFRSEPLRLSPHVPARLVAAASLHGCGLVWIDSPIAIEQIARLLTPVAEPPPVGATAVGIIRLPRSLERVDYIRAGRAACRVWLEAASLGLAVLSIAPTWLDGTSPVAEYDPDDAALDVAILWFGAAA